MMVIFQFWHVYFDALRSSYSFRAEGGPRLLMRSDLLKNIPDGLIFYTSRYGALFIPSWRRLFIYVSFSRPTSETFWWNLKKKKSCRGWIFFSPRNIIGARYIWSTSPKWKILKFLNFQKSAFVIRENKASDWTRNLKQGRQIWKRESSLTTELELY